jgi:hypothetical protein
LRDRPRLAAAASMRSTASWLRSRMRMLGMEILRKPSVISRYHSGRSGPVHALSRLLP